mmetsp:Transcript_9840/g.18857  ORF Transcript_9840/g.18857 Transcript_9840/m.18857 type:complete len:90 (+) Transcript_9840:148-417(+)
MEHLSDSHRQLVASTPFIISSTVKVFIMVVVLVGFWFYYRAQFDVDVPIDECTVVSLDSDREEDGKDLEAVTTDGNSGDSNNRDRMGQQ